MLTDKLDVDNDVLLKWQVSCYLSGMHDAVIIKSE